MTGISVEPSERGKYTVLTVNGEAIAGAVEMPLVGFDEPAPGGGAPQTSEGAVAGVPGEAV